MVIPSAHLQTSLSLPCSSASNVWLLPVPLSPFSWFSCLLAIPSHAHLQPCPQIASFRCGELESTGFQPLVPSVYLDWPLILFSSHTYIYNTSAYNIDSLQSCQHLITFNQLYHLAQASSSLVVSIKIILQAFFLPLLIPSLMVNNDGLLLLFLSTWYKLGSSWKMES